MNYINFSLYLLAGRCTINAKPLNAVIKIPHRIWNAQTRAPPVVTRLNKHPGKISSETPPRKYLTTFSSFFSTKYPY